MIASIKNQSNSKWLWQALIAGPVLFAFWLILSTIQSSALPSSAGQIPVADACPSTVSFYTEGYTAGTWNITNSTIYTRNGTVQFRAAQPDGYPATGLPHCNTYHFFLAKTRNTNFSDTATSGRYFRIGYGTSWTGNFATKSYNTTNSYDYPSAGARNIHVAFTSCNTDGADSGYVTNVFAAAPGTCSALQGVVTNRVWYDASVPSLATRVQETYNPTRTISFAAGTYSCYQFNTLGAITATNTYTLGSASSAPASGRDQIRNQSGSWFSITAGVWSGYYCPQNGSIDVRNGLAHWGNDRNVGIAQWYSDSGGSGLNTTNTQYSLASDFSTVNYTDSYNWPASYVEDSAGGRYATRSVGADGIWYVRASGTDWATNVEPYGGSENYTRIDTVAPADSVSGAYVETRTASRTYDMSASDANSGLDRLEVVTQRVASASGACGTGWANLSTTWYDIDGYDPGTWSAAPRSGTATSWSGSHTVSGMATGYCYRIAIRAYDSAENVAAWDYSNATMMDTTTPTSTGRVGRSYTGHNTSGRVAVIPAGSSLTAINVDAQGITTASYTGSWPSASSVYVGSRQFLQGQNGWFYHMPGWEDRWVSETEFNSAGWYFRDGLATWGNNASIPISMHWIDNGGSGVGYYPSSGGNATDNGFVRWHISNSCGTAPDYRGDITYISIPQSAPQFTSYASRYSQATTTGTGTYCSWSVAKDNVGNWESPGYPAAADATAQLDVDYPTGTVAIAGGAATTTNNTVTLNITASDVGSGLDRMRFSNDGTTWSTWENYATTRTGWVLSGSYGTKTVYMQLVDNAENYTTAVNTDTIDYVMPDTTAPVCNSSVINSGAASTGSTSVSMTNNASDAVGVTQIRHSNDNSTWSAWSSYSTSTAWTLTSGTGTKTVYTQVRDTAGNVSNTCTDSIVLDQTGPTGSIVINGGATYTNNVNVTLTLSASDNSGTVTDMRFINMGGSTWSAWEPYSTSKAWTLPTGDGSTGTYVQYRDSNGNSSIHVSGNTINDTIILDTTPPTGTISINNDASSVNTINVTLTLSATDALSGMGSMRFSNDNSTWSSWEAYTTSKAWSLAGGASGTRTVYVQYRDVAQNVSTTAISDSINYVATTMDGTIQINSGAAYTTSTSVTLALSGTSTSTTVTDMRFSNDSGATWSAWEPYSTSKAWTLSTGAGTKRVDVQYRDNLTNTTTAGSINDNIIFDNTAPSCGAPAININSGATYSATTSVTLTLSASDVNGVGTMRFSNDNSTWSTWQAYSTSYSWTLTSGDGAKTVWVQFRDNAGNTQTACASDGIILDTTSPNGSIVIAGGAAYTSSNNVTLTLSATDSSSTVTNMRFSNDNSTWNSWEAYSTTRTGWALTSGDGTKTVYVQYRDGAGNVSSTYNDNIIKDTTGPTGSIIIDGGATYTYDLNITLTLSATDTLSSVSDMRFSNDNSTWSAYQPYATSIPWTLTTGDGTKTVYIQYRDSLGNSSATYTDTIILDTTIPSCTISIDAGASYTVDPDVELALNATATGSRTITNMSFSADGATWSPWTAYSASSNYAWALDPPDDGAHTVYFRVSDSAGIIGQCSDGIILDTENPTGSIVINSGAKYTNSVNINLTLSATDAGSGVNNMRFSTDGITFGAWEAYNTARAWTLSPATNDNRELFVQFRDASGRMSPVYSDNILLDTVAPDPVSVDSPAGSTSANVTLTLSYVDNSADFLSYSNNTTGEASMRLSNTSAGLSSATWQSFANTYPWTFSAGDGAKTIYAQFRDGAGNITTQVSDTTTLDSTAPSCAITIDGGATYATDTSVDLALSSNDAGVGSITMRFSNNNSTWSAWEPYSASKTWALSTGDGSKTVYAQFRDGLSNTSGCNDGIALVTSGPSGSLGIDGTPGGTPSTPPGTYTFITTHDAAVNSSSPNNNDNGTGLEVKSGGMDAYVRFNVTGTSGSFNSAVLRFYVTDATNNGGTLYSVADNTWTETTLNWNNRPALGSSIVGMGNISSGAWVEIDVTSLVTGEGQYSFAIVGEVNNNGIYSSKEGSNAPELVIGTDMVPGSGRTYAGFTGTVDVTLHPQATQAGVTVDTMQFSNDGTIWGPIAPYSNADHAWSLAAGGDGTRTVYARYTNSAGLTSVASNTIILDTTGPTGSLAINGGAASTSDENVVLNITASDVLSGMWQMRFSADGTNFGAWEAYGASKTWTLPAGDGSKTVYIQFRDNLGNESVVYNDTIVVSSAPPTGTVVINSGAASTNTINVTLTPAASDPGGLAITNMRFGNSLAAVSSATWIAYSTVPYSWTLTTGDGTKTVYAQYRNSLGMESIEASDTILLDTTGPSGSVVIEGGAATTNSLTVTLDLTAADTHSTVAEMRLSNTSAGLSSASWQPYATTLSGWVLSSGDGTKSVFVQYRDNLGNVGPSTSDTIIMDASGPSGTIVINNGEASTAILDVTLQPSAVDAGVGMSGGSMRFSNDNSTWSAWVAYSSADYDWTLAAGTNGTRTVYAQYRDNLGNMSTVVNDTIEYEYVTQPIQVSASARIQNTPDNCGLVGAPVTINDNGNLYWQTDRRLCVLPGFIQNQEGLDYDLSDGARIYGNVVGVDSYVVGSNPNDPALGPIGPSDFAVSKAGTEWSSFVLRRETTGVDSLFNYEIPYNITLEIEWTDDAGVVRETETQTFSLTLYVTVRNVGVTR